MNVLVLSQVFWPDNVAVSLFITDLCQKMADQGYQVTVIAGRYDYENHKVNYSHYNKLENINIIRLKNTGMGKSSMLFRLIDFFSFNFLVFTELLSIKKNKYDVAISTTVPPMLSFMTALFAPVKKYKVSYEEDAIIEVIDQTEGYPFFLQVWGSNAWDLATGPTITLKDIKKATKQAYIDLDSGFYKVRYDRLTIRQQQYVVAIAKTPSLPAKSGEIAKILNMSVKKAAPIRDELIKKGMVYSPGFGLTTFTVPKFDAFLQRTVIK